MFSSKWLYFAIFISILHIALPEISDKRLCVDDLCSDLISAGKTLQTYASTEGKILSFKRNEDVKIFSYGAGERPELIGVEIAGKRGYVNKEFVREINLIKLPKKLVDTELVKDKPRVPSVSAPKGVKIDPSQQSFEIVEGTKLPFDLAGLSTEVPILHSENEYRNADTTKPLGIVPDYKNLPSEPKDVSKENEKIEQIQTEKKLDEDESEDDEVVEDDEDEEEDEDGDSEAPKAEDPANKEANLPHATASDNDLDSVVKGSLDGPTNNAPKGIVNEVTKEDGKEKLFENDPMISIQKSESADVLQNDTVNQKTDTILRNTNITENDVDSGKQSVENTPQESGVSELQKSPSVPASNEPYAIPGEPPITGDTTTPSVGPSTNGEQVNNSSVITEISTFNSSTAEENSPVPAEIEPNVQDSTTETSLEVDILQPLNLDSVTGNPLKIEREEQKSAVVSAPPENASPSGSVPNNKEPEEYAGDKVERPAISGILGGLGSILPLFSVASDTNKLDTSPEVEAPLAETTKENDLKPIEHAEIYLEENKVTDTPEYKEHEQNSPTSFSAQSGLNQEHVIDAETISSNESLVIETPTLESGRGADSSPQSDQQGIFSPGTDSGSKESGEGIVQSNKEIASGTAGEELQNNGERKDGLTVDRTADALGTSQNDVVNVKGNEGSNSHNHWSSSANEFQSEGNIETCDSLSEKCRQVAKEGFCDNESEDCPSSDEGTHSPDKRLARNISIEELQDIFIESLSSDMFLYLSTTSMSVLILIFVWILVDKCRREGPLIARINKLEQQLLATMKENEVLQQKSSSDTRNHLQVETMQNELETELKQRLAEASQSKMLLEQQVQALEGQVQALEKELDTSTEVGIELNKILSEMLSSKDGSELLKDNIQEMQQRVLEQQDTINTLNETLNLKDTENYELRLELEITNKKVIDLQGEVDKMVEKILRIEEERDQQYNTLENEIRVYQNKCKEALTQEYVLRNEISASNQKVAELQRIADIKTKEYNTLKETFSTIKSVKNDKDALKSFLDVSEIKAQLEQIKSENLKYSEQLSQEREMNMSYTTQIQKLSHEVEEVKEKYENADKEKVEVTTKLEILNSYFKEKEDQMQKEISKYESLWAAREGEATSTTERIRYMQEELQNCKSQNETLKQEIMNQEVELKSQISMLEKKAHENWVATRQVERKLEEARQEAALLRNRLTMRERAVAEGNNHMRIQSPLHQNGEIPLSPPPIDPTQSPPPLFNPRDHMTKSPPIPGMPPPFLPPPLGAAPFMPPPPLEGMMPPLGDMGGMPPPFIPGLHPGMFPGDHRPPPLGRMSSPPPVGGRYSPESTVYSEYDRYDRRSPSPTYDSEYGASPPPIRGYSPYDERDRNRFRDDRREYKRPQPRTNGRNSKGIHSSGSENDSLGKVSKKPQRKV